MRVHGITEEVPRPASGTGDPVGCSTRGVTRLPRPQALPRVGEQVWINPEKLRNWVSQVETDGGHLPGVSSEYAKRIGDLE